MSEKEKNKQPHIQITEAAKPGLFKRFVNKLDDAMKAKAEEKGQQSNCCLDDSKGGKCC